jgi:hypothetical protein
MVSSACSVHSPLSLIRKTDFVLISPSTKPQLRLLQSSTSLTSVSSHRPSLKARIRYVPAPSSKVIKPFAFRFRPASAFDHQHQTVYLELGHFNLA